VLIDSLMPDFPGRLAARTGADPHAARRLLTDDAFRRAYWGGHLPEEAFWMALDLDAPDDSRRVGILDLRARVDPARVAGWAGVADVWIISNHRHEWLLPALAAHGLDDLVDRIEVSSLTGRVKPDPGAWEVLLEAGTPASRVAVVDDQQANLDAAAALGLTAIHAAGDGAWADALDAWLASRA
jgi:FMN phosphatase YigB (HAD superfamily)